MATSQFRRYTPNVSTYSKRRSDEEWNEHRPLLTRLHKQHYTRRQMLEHLRASGFTVTSGQLLAQMKKWNLTVYGTCQHRSAPDIAIVPPAQVVQPDIKNTNKYEQTEFDRQSDHIDAGYIGGLHIANGHDGDNQECRTQGAEHSDDMTFSSSSDTAVEHGSIPESDFEGIPITDESIEHSSNVARERIEWQLTSSEAIRSQLPIILDPWCERFPMSCCCNSLLFVKEKFRNSHAIYRMMLQQSHPDSLQHVWALLSLDDLSLIHAGDEYLYNTFRAALERYLRLCTRTDLKNKQANLILHRLLKRWPEIDNYTPSSMNRATAYDTFRKLFRMKLPGTQARQKFMKFDWESISERDLGVVVGFTARKPSAFPLLNWSGTLFGDTQSWDAVEGQDDANQLLHTADALSQYMQDIWTKQETNMLDLGGCDLPTVFNALGLMIALEMDEYARSLIFEQGEVASIEKWPNPLKSFIETTITTLSLNSEYADKFRKCYWLGRVEKIGIDGKNIHLGPCSCTYHWQVLSRDIHLYDEPRTWIEKTLFSNPGSWPRPEDFAENDNASVRSTSSLGSFRRFQALALQLKLGTPLSRSIRSKSTKSKNSLDSHMSWQLETMLEIKEDETHLEDKEQVQDLDEEAYQQMQERADGPSEDRPFMQDLPDESDEVNEKNELT